MTKKTIAGRDGIAGIDDIAPLATVRQLEWCMIDECHYEAGPWSVQRRVSLWMAFSPFSDDALCMVQSAEAALDIAQKDFEHWVSASLIPASAEEAVPERPASDTSAISEGFLEGWFVQDRPSEGTAILVAPPGLRDMATGGRAICLKPRLLKTEEWLPTARRIAERLTTRDQPQRMRVARSAKPEIKPLSWVGRPAAYRPDRMVFRASAMGRQFEVIQNDNGSWGPHGRFTNYEDAMRAVQADYEAPIIAAMAEAGSILPASKLDVIIAEPCAPPLY